MALTILRVPRNFKKSIKELNTVRILSGLKLNLEQINVLLNEYVEQSEMLVEAIKLVGNI